MDAYLIVKDSLIDFINEEQLSIGDKLPTEKELCNMFRVSRVTLREAMRWLQENGFIYSKRGSGTYVSGNLKEIAGTLDVNKGLTKMIREAGYAPGVKYYETELMHANIELSRKLNVKKGCNVVLLKRVRTANDNPVVYSLDYLGPNMAAIFLSIDEKILSLFSLIEKSGISIGNSFAEICPEVCSPELSKKLSYKEGAPILSLKQRLVDEKGFPLFYGEDYFRPDCFTFSINRKRN
jgi:GntR family transcriptional regulator